MVGERFAESTVHGSHSALPICRWAQQGRSWSRPCPGKLSQDWRCILVWFRMWLGFWLLSPHPHLSLSSLLFFSERPSAPGLLGCLLQLAPITVPDHSPGPCGDKVPWAPRSGEWRAVCRSTIEGGWFQGELVWPVFPPLVASRGSGGAEWAEVGGQGGLCCLLPALPRPYLPAQPHLALRHLITDHIPGKEVLRMVGCLSESPGSSLPSPPCSVMQSINKHP